MASKDRTAHAIDPSYLSEGTQVSYTAVQSDALKDSSPIEVSDSPSKHEHIIMWIRILNLTVKDKQIVDGNGWCNDQIIYSAQKLLELKFPNIMGWQSPQFSCKKNLFTKVPRGVKFIQIMLTRGNHWITVSNVEENFSSVEEPPAAQLYDSLRSINIDSKLKSDVCSSIGSKLNRVQFHIMNVEGQCICNTFGSR